MISFFSGDNLTDSGITSNTAKELLELNNFLNVEEFHISDIPETFDIETFFAYFKVGLCLNNNIVQIFNFLEKKFIKFGFECITPISNAYQIRLEKIVDEVLGTEIREYKAPFISFIELDDEKWTKMYSIYYA